jgi:hypothetical protein
MFQQEDDTLPKHFLPIVWLTGRYRFGMRVGKSGRTAAMRESFFEI